MKLIKATKVISRSKPLTILKSLSRDKMKKVRLKLLKMSLGKPKKYPKEQNNLKILYSAAPSINNGFNLVLTRM